jgi:hypothetical protein
MKFPYSVGVSVAIGDFLSSKSGYLMVSNRD